jgi:ketosteroid isomerase-like protein
MTNGGELAGVLRRLDRLESESAIRTVVATYFDLCDRLDGATPLDELGALFTEDAVWRGTGARYGAAFGEHRGRAAIVAMFARYAGPVPHFTFNAHVLGSERIAVDGDRASGRWIMLQTSTYAAGHSDLRAARLALAFERLAEGWQIARFETENLFSRHVDRWNDQAPIAVPAE